TFGFGNYICRAMKTLYANGNSFVKLSHGTSQRRDLLLKGHVLRSKAEGISRFTYVASPVHLDRKTAKTIDKMLFNFLWKNRVNYI
ncbi:hypothetical protein Z043_119342, partial [Scleropages formosus]